MKRQPVCPLHNRPLLCPACIGAKGGKVKTPAKTKAAQDNIKPVNDAKRVTPKGD